MLVDCGFTVKTNDLKVDLKTANKIINSKNYHKFSRVEYDGGKFIFRQEYTECPICGAVFDAREIMKSEPVIHTSYEIDCFFSQHDNNCSNEKNSIQLNKAVLKNKPRIECPFCYSTIYKSKSKRKIHLSSDDSSLSVKIEIKNIKELIDCLVMVSDDLTIDIGNELMLSSCEILTFEKDGRTYLSFSNDENDYIFRKDITENYCYDSVDSVLCLVSHNMKIKCFIVNYLKQFWCGKFPFDADKLNLKDFITLNRFKGFNTSYYSAVPYELGTQKTDGSFTVFKNCEEAAEALNGYDIPKSKTIRKSIFAKQGLLFYLPELEMLYKSLNNIDIFNQIINNKQAEILLYYLHTYPGVNQFITDFCNTPEQKRKFVRLFIASAAQICIIAKDYAELNEYYKKKLQDEKFEEYVRKMSFRDELCSEPGIIKNKRYSMPFKIQRPSLEDTVFGCSFRYLKSTNDTKNAGEELGNCLREWQCSDNNVVVIKRGSRIVAAIELDENSLGVEQVRLAQNRSIKENKTISKSFYAWLNKHKLFYFDNSIFDVWDEFDENPIF